MSTSYAGFVFQQAPLFCVPEFYDYTFTVVLQSITYQVRLCYNRRGKFWAMSLFDADGTPRIEGRKLVANWPTMDKIPQARPDFGQLVTFADNDVPFEQSDLGQALVPAFTTFIPE